MNGLPQSVATESRSRVGINWYATAADADRIAEHYREPQYAQSVANANIGIIQVGRAPEFDRERDGIQQYAVVVP